MYKTLLNLSITAIALCITGSMLPAQIPDTAWTRTYGGFDNDYGYDIKQTSDGGFIIAGNAASFGPGWWNIYLVKTDADGDTIWTTTYEADEADIALSVEQCRDGGYIAACDGFTDLIRLDENGDSIWTSNLGIDARVVHQTDDGGFIVGGIISVESYGHACLVKTDSLGDSVWYYTYQDGDVSEITSLQPTNDGRYIACGLIYSSESWWDYLLIKIDESGDTLWTKTYGTIPSPEEAYAVHETIDGGYIITGLWFWTIKTNALGDSVWSNYYGYGEIGCAYSICQTIDGGYMLFGYIDPLGSDDAQAYIVRIDSAGNSLGDAEYGTPGGWDYGNSISPVDDGGFIMTGWTDSYGEGQKDIWVIRTFGEQAGMQYVPGDANMYNGDWPPAVIGSDVTYLVNYFRGLTANPACLLDGFYAPADINGSCSVIGSDVTRLVNYFRGIGTIEFCPDYYPAWLTPANCPSQAPSGWPNCE